MSRATEVAWIFPKLRFATTFFVFGSMVVPAKLAPGLANCGWLSVEKLGAKFQRRRFARPPTLVDWPTMRRLA